jgi:hypothetical protein
MGGGNIRVGGAVGKEKKQKIRQRNLPEKE